MFHDGQVSHYLDGRDEANSSWMRFVRCARHKKEQNMVVFQYHGCVYYRTIREILPGQELLVWYDTRYSQFMGVPVALSDSGSRGECFYDCGGKCNGHLQLSYYTHTFLHVILIWYLSDLNPMSINRGPPPSGSGRPRKVSGQSG